jgi:PleD family two-component response regulator
MSMPASVPLEILLVDDDCVTRERLAADLGAMGHHVRQFADGLEAWEAFDREPTRVVISDWKMPGIDGVEFCQRVRNRLRTDYTYFILITANGPGALGYDYAIGEDVDDFLVKPVERGQLWRRMRVAARILRFTTEMRQLEQLLPICTYCHKIREGDDGAWQPLERYVGQRTGSNFSHGVCPDCESRWMAELQVGMPPQ